MNCEGITLFKGDAGVGIASITWTSNSAAEPQGTEGTVDTYTITYTDTTTTTFILTNGATGMYGGFSSEWLYDGTSIVPAFLTASDFRFNNGTLTSVTELYIHDTNADSTVLQAFLDAFTNGSNFGLIRISKKSDSNIFWMGTITGNLDVGSYHTVTVTHVQSNGTFTNDDSCIISFAASGNTGANGLGWTGGSYSAGTGISTFTSTDGLGFATGDLRGANGANGTDGTNGAVVLADSMTIYTAGDAVRTIVINTNELVNDGDTIIIDHLLTAVAASPGAYRFVNSGGSPGSSVVIVSHTFDVVTDTNAAVRITLVKSGTTVIGHGRIMGDPSFAVYKFTMTNFFGAATTDFQFNTTNAVGQSTIDDIVITKINKLI